MKKNKLAKLIMTLYTIPAMAIPAFAGVDYDAGMNAYNRGDMDFAKILFKKAMQVDYYDVNARYMYCQILTKEKKYSEAKQEYEKIIKIAPSSQAASYAKIGIEKIDEYNNKLSGSQNKTQTASQQNTDNAVQTTATDYVKNAYRGGQKYLRPRGVVRVYIDSDEVLKPMMQQAYSEWQSALGSNVMFSFAATKSNATDIVTFSNGSAGLGVLEGGRCEYNIDGTTLKGNKIVINAYDKDGNLYPKPVIYHTMLHEIGHSVGILGHSPYSGDVMYQGAKTFLPHLSERDKNTVRLLYQTYGKQPDLKSIEEAKNAELIAIAEKIPNDPSSYIDLGDEAMSEGQYTKAISYYKKAENLIQSVDIYYREIKAYRALGDNDNIFVCYKNILLIEKDNKTALGNILSMYQQQSRFREARAVLDDFINKNPDKAKDEDILKYKHIFSDKNIKALDARERIFGGAKIK